jgi:general secretion pathway protein B
MSYILDALRKADAERERDPARGIHAQPAPLPAQASSRLPSWIAGTAAGVAVLAAGGAWLMRSTPVGPAVAVAPASNAAPAAAPATLQPSAGFRQVPAPAPAVLPVAVAVTPPAPPPLPAPERAPAKAVVATVVKAPAPARATSAAAAPAAAAAGPALAAAPGSAPVTVATTPARAAPVARSPVAAAAPVATAPVADRVLTAAELPADVQQALPKLQISGGVYSDNAAQRMLIVGGQVMNEGAELAPGAVLEQIKPHAAILKFRGYRYSVAY